MGEDHIKIIYKWIMIMTFYKTSKSSQYGKDVVNTAVKRTLESSPSTNVLVAISKGMQAVKLCFNKILQFLIKMPGGLLAKAG